MSQVITIKTFERFYPRITKVVELDGKKYKLLDCIEKEYTVNGDTKTGHYELTLELIE
jgi:hypothetical protein